MVFSASLPRTGDQDQHWANFTGFACYFYPGFYVLLQARELRVGITKRDVGAVRGKQIVSP